MTKTNASAAVASKTTAAQIAKESTGDNRQRAAAIEADLRKIAKETGAPRIAEVEQARNKLNKPSAGLANGVDGRSAPHSAKAVKDSAAKDKAATAPAANKADAKAARSKAATDSKAARASAKADKAAPKADDNRKVTILDKAFTYGREGTERNKSWLACEASKTVADYASAGGKLKYLPRWVSANAIKLG